MWNVNNFLTKSNQLFLMTILFLLFGSQFTHSHSIFYIDSYGFLVLFVVNETNHWKSRTEELSTQHFFNPADEHPRTSQWRAFCSMLLPVFMSYSPCHWLVFDAALTVRSLCVSALWWWDCHIVTMARLTYYSSSPIVYSIIVLSSVFLSYFFCCFLSIR